MEKSKKLIQTTIKFGFKASDVVSVKIFDTDFVLLLKNGKKITLKDGAMLAMTQPDIPINFEDTEVTAGKLLKLVGQVDLTGTFETVQSTPETRVQSTINENQQKSADADKDNAASNSLSPTTNSQTTSVIPSPEPVNKALNDSIAQLQQQIEHLSQQLNQKNTNNSQTQTTPSVALSETDVQPPVVEKPADPAAAPATATTPAPANNYVAAPSVTETVASNNTVNSTAPAPESTTAIDTQTANATVNQTVTTAQVTPAPSAPTSSAPQAVAGGVTPVAVAAKEGGFLSSISPQWGALGALGALGGGGGGGSSGSGVAAVVSSTSVSGAATFGPVVSGNDLEVNAYDSKGNWLTSSGVDANGGFKLNLGKIYEGNVILSVSSRGANLDYLDEATGKNKNLDSTLYSVSTISSGQLTKSIQINPATQMAANDLLDTSKSTAPVIKSSVTAQVIADKNIAISKSLGLGSSDITAMEVIPTVDISGKTNVNANALGKFLEQISNLEKETGKTTVEVLSQVSNQLTTNNGSQALSQMFINIKSDLMAPTFTSKSSASADENADPQTVVYLAAATTNAGVSKYSIKSDTGDGALFTIDSTTGEVRLIKSADYETKTSYAFTVVAAVVVDGNNKTTEQAVTLSVVDKNDNAPIFNSPDTVSLLTSDINNLVVYTTKTLDRDGTATNRPVSYSLKQIQGDDAGLLYIDAGTGEVSLKQTPDPITKSNYSFTVVATNAASDVTQTAEQAVTLTLSSPNQKPTSTNSTLIADGSYYYLKKDTFVFIDADTDSNYNQFQKIKITALPTQGSMEYLNNGSWNTISVNQEFTVADLQNNALRYSPQTTVSNTNFSYFLFKVSDGFAWSDSPNAMAINVALLSPVFSSGNAGNLDENSVASKTIYTASASASKGQVSYSLKQSGDVSLLTIDGLSGAVQLKNSADYESKPTYNFTVIATLNLDGSASSVEQPVTVSVNDVNDCAPVFTSSASANVTLSDNSKAIYTAITTDADGTVANRQVSYSLKNTGDAAYLSIDAGSGVVSLSDSSPDLNIKPNYAFTVVASNNASTRNLSTEKDVTLTLTSSNMRPTTGNNSISIDGTGSYVFNANDFIFSDADQFIDSSKGTFQKIKIMSTPTTGQISFNNVNISVGQEITVSDITAGKLIYTYSQTANLANYAIFSYQVSDGYLFSNSSGQTTFNVNIGNRAPTFNALAQTRDIVEDSTVLTTTTGTPSASRTYVMTDADNDNMHIDTQYLTDNGWVQDSNNVSIFSKTGSYGTASFNVSFTNSTIVATYQLNNNNSHTQALTPSDTVQEVFNIKISDSKNAATLVPITFSIKGNKDLVINNPLGENLNYTEVSPSPDTFLPVTGNLLKWDTAFADLTLGIPGATAITLMDGKYDLKYTNTYGDFYLASSGTYAGNYKFVPNDTAINNTVPNPDQRSANGGYDNKLSFDVTVSASGVTTSIPVNININSVYDSPAVNPQINNLYANQSSSRVVGADMFGITNYNNTAASNMKISISGVAGFATAAGDDPYLNSSYFYNNTRANIVGTDGYKNITESSTVTFSDLAANQTVTIGGMSFKSTGSTAAANVAAAFASYTSGSTPRSSIYGNLTGRVNGFNSGLVSGNTVKFTSTTAAANVTDLTASGTGVSLTTTQGGSAFESARVTFSDMSAGDMVTLGNMSFVASQAATATQVAALFRGKSSGITPTTSLGSFSGTLALWDSTSDASNGNQVTFQSSSNTESNVTAIIYKNKISNFTLADVTAGNVSFYNGSENTMPTFTAKVTDTVAGMDSPSVTTPSGFLVTGAVFPSNALLHSGKLVFGDASGGGGGGAPWSTNNGVSGVNGQANKDTLNGSDDEDIIFGDGSGGGAGAMIALANGNTLGLPGKAGGAADSISGGAGNDILFGDGFSGSYQTVNSLILGTNGGYGGGGGGGNRRGFADAFGKGGIGGGNGYSNNILPGDATDGFASTLGHSRTGLAGAWGSAGSGGGGGGGVSATGQDDTNSVTAGLDPQIYNKVISDLGTPNSDIFNQVMGNGDDTIDGGAGDDWIMGGFGNDLIIGGSGNDTLWGRGGTNTITKYAYTYVNGAAASPESASFIFTPSDTLSAGDTLSVAGLTITAVRDLTGQELASALSGISTGGTPSSVGGSYSISGNLTSGWLSSALTSTGSGAAAVYTVKFQTSGNGNVLTNPVEMTRAITTLNTSDNDTFQWNAGDASAGSLSTDTIKDFKAWDGSSGDKMDISGLLSALGYQGSSLSDWVSFTAASGNTAARIDIDTGANSSVVQTIVLENASLGTNTSLQQLINNGVLVA